ncbi:hypothetical protein Bca52824_091361 [Brassica carinata]|uniref:CCT domain-containing protein n=1 Tax=Brassica carinata TaxID=52824 RepID=A0A8X7TF81_BRACI|nr:hypothetical protein Bca52824_091361 [Brassica carinata]
MYSETGVEFRFMQDCSPDFQQFDDLFKSYKLSDETINLVEACEYDFGEESDLLKTPEQIIEEPVLAVDPLSQEIVELSDLVHKAFHDCEQDLLVKPVMESPFSEVLDIKNVSSVADMDNVMKISSVVVSDVSVPKSVSSENISSMDMAQHEDGMRRAFSESDIQTLGTTNAGLVPSQLDRIIITCTSEDRREKLSRYRNKKSRRNFGRKIKYACRKALADNQPRIRGRFAKTEEMH